MFFRAFVEIKNSAVALAFLEVKFVIHLTAVGRSIGAPTLLEKTVDKGVPSAIASALFFAKPVSDLDASRGSEQATSKPYNIMVFDKKMNRNEGASLKLDFMVIE